MGELLKGKVLFPGTDCILPEHADARGRAVTSSTWTVVFDLMGFRRRLGGSVPLVHCCRL